MVEGFFLENGKNFQKVPDSDAAYLVVWDFYRTKKKSHFHYLECLQSVTASALLLTEAC